MNLLVNPRFNRRQIHPGADCKSKSLFPRHILPALSFAALLCSILTGQESEAAASFSNSPPLITARSGQTATLLFNGKLLVVGGMTNVDLTTAATELYDPATGIWSATGSMNA